MIYKLSKNEEAVFRAILKECRQTGVCPTAGRLVEVSGVARASMRRCTARLVELGLVGQQYFRGPYYPARDERGRPVSMKIITAAGA